jgi:hypothetical protein
VTPKPALAPDAAIVLGIASTAMPFARSREAEAERWLRILRLHGEAGVALCALGVTEAPLQAVEEHANGEASAPPPKEDADPMASVTDRAEQVAGARGVRSIGSVEVLLAVMDVYEDCFERVLEAHGTDGTEVRERLGISAP